MRQIGLIISILGLMVSLNACTSAKFPLGTTRVTPKIQSVPVLKTSDGTELLMQVWQPSHKPRARILLLHGFNEYTGAYDSVGLKFGRMTNAVLGVHRIADCGQVPNVWRRMHRKPYS
jgi:hypothetical protein